jgi:hypothetical protein
LTGNTDESPLTADAGEDETLPESEDRAPEKYPSKGDPMAVALEKQTLEDQVENLIGGHVGNQLGSQITDVQQEKLELTEADRRLLEEELSLDIDDDASTDITDEHNAAAPAGQSLDDTIDLGSFHHTEGDESAIAEDFPASPTAAEAQPDLAEPSGGETPETFDFDFDEAAEDDAMAQSGPPMTPPPADYEDLSIESILADSDATDNAEQVQPLDGAEGTPEAGGAGPVTPTEIEIGKEMQAAGASEMALDPPDTPDPLDGLTAAETMSIPAVGLADQHRADGEGPADKLNEPTSETLSKERLEAVVEQAVKKLFGEKIETMLFDAIEKAVTKEIDRLKTLILGDIDHDR